MDLKIMVLKILPTSLPRHRWTGRNFGSQISPPTQIRASTLGAEKTSWIGSARLRLIHSSAEAIQYCNPRLITRSCG